MLAIFYLGERSLTSVSSSKNSRTFTRDTGFKWFSPSAPSGLCSTFTAVKTFPTPLTKCAMRTSYTLHLSLIYVSLHSVSPSVLLLVIYLPQQRCKNHKDSEFCLLCFLLKPQRLVSYIPGPQQGFRNICLKM